MQRRILAAAGTVIILTLIPACESGTQDFPQTTTTEPISAKPTATTYPRPTPKPFPNPPSPDASVAEQVLELTNSNRAANGAAPLTLNPQLTAAAQAFAEAMATQGFFDHTAPDGSTPGDRIIATGYDPYTWGENIAYGYKTADAVMQGWMNSSGHRANILNGSFKEIGIGYALSGSTAYWVQDFGAQ